MQKYLLQDGFMYDGIQILFCAPFSDPGKLVEGDAICRVTFAGPSHRPVYVVSSQSERGRNLQTVFLTCFRLFLFSFLIF